MGYMYLQDLTRVVVPPTSLMHPGREAAGGAQLLIRRETPAYLAASLWAYNNLKVVPLSATSGGARMQF